MDKRIFQGIYRQLLDIPKSEWRTGTERIDRYSTIRSIEFRKSGIIDVIVVNADGGLAAGGSYQSLSWGQKRKLRRLYSEMRANIAAIAIHNITI